MVQRLQRSKAGREGGQEVWNVEREKLNYEEDKISIGLQYGKRRTLNQPLYGIDVIASEND